MLHCLRIGVKSTRVVLGNILIKAVPPIIFGLVLFSIWELLVQFGDIKPYILPSLRAVLRTMVDPKWRWLDQMWVTAIEVLGGYVMAASIGIALGVVITWTRLAQGILPFLVIVNSLPKIAMAPLFIIWLGYGIVPNIIIAFISAFFPVVINTATGIINIDPDFVNFARALGTPQWKIFLKIRLPNALPHIWAGLKISTSLAVIGALVGEFIAATRGLASSILHAQASLATHAIFAALVWIALLGLGLYAVVCILQKVLTPWAD